MPELSRFLGIIIYMNFRDHNPPHFHASYGDFDITVELNTGVVEGKFPKRALGHVLEWYDMHKEELLTNWQLVKEGKFTKIQPLE